MTTMSTLESDLKNPTYNLPTQTTQVDNNELIETTTIDNDGAVTGIIIGFVFYSIIILVVIGSIFWSIERYVSKEQGYMGDSNGASGVAITFSLIFLIPVSIPLLMYYKKHIGKNRTKRSNNYGKMFFIYGIISIICATLSILLIIWSWFMNKNWKINEKLEKCIKENNSLRERLIKQNATEL